MPEPERRTPANAEVRVGHARLRVERRDASDKGPEQIVGHAAVFDQWTTLYEGRYWTWRECVRPGAFRRAIAERQDVRSLYNHDPNFLLGRTKSRTLELAEDSTGLLSRTTPSDAQWVRDMVLTPIGREDLDGMSFAFGVRRGKTRTETQNPDGSVTIEDGGERITVRYEGERTIEERELLDLDLYDVSPVTYPAYDGTDVGLRALGADVQARAKEMDVPRRSATPPAETPPAADPAADPAPPADALPGLLAGLHEFQKFDF